MWAIKWLLAVIVILAVLGFALQNSKDTVSVVLINSVWQGQLWVVIYASFGLGVLFWLIVSVFQVFQLKGEIRKVKKINHELQNELDSLRNLPIGEDDMGFDIKEET